MERKHKDWRSQNDADVAKKLHERKLREEAEIRTLARKLAEDDKKETGK